MRRAPAVVALLLVSACARDGRTLRPPSPDQTLSIVTTTTGATTTIGLKPASIGTVAPTAKPAAKPATTLAGATVPPATAPAAAGPFTLVLPWADGATIDPSYTCTGGNGRPTVSWTGVPSGATELALLVEDDDAGGFVHWLVGGIPPNAASLPPGGLPTGSAQALNSFGNPGWGGPCPPAGAAHHYRTQLFALNAPSGITNGMGTEAAKAALQKNVVGLATLTGQS